MQTLTDTETITRIQTASLDTTVWYKDRHFKLTSNGWVRIRANGTVKSQFLPLSTGEFVDLILDGHAEAQELGIWTPDQTDKQTN